MPKLNQKNKGEADFKMDPAQGRDIPAEIFRDSFKSLQLEMRAGTLGKQIRDFSGDGAKRFRDWLCDIDRVGQALQADDERYKTLAFQSLKGAAGTFLSRYTKDHANHTWAQIKEALIAQYEEDGDAHLAKQKLRRLQQKSGESVQNFAERILTLAHEAYENVDQALVQTMLVDVLIDGVQDDAIAKRLIKAHPERLNAALTIAVNEQSANRHFKMRRRAEEPMEIDSLGDIKGAQDGRLDRLEQGLALVVEKLEQILVSTRPPKAPQNRWQTGPNRVDGKPVCFGCGKVGHIKRDCRAMLRPGSYASRMTQKEN